VRAAITVGDHDQAAALGAEPRGELVSDGAESRDTRVVVFDPQVLLHQVGQVEGGLARRPADVLACWAAYPAQAPIVVEGAQRERVCAVVKLQV
jgi:hypothetical protein